MNKFLIWTRRQQRHFLRDFPPRNRWVAQMHRAIYNMLLPRTGWHLIPFPPPQRVYGRTLRHNQIFSDGCFTKFYYPWCSAGALCAPELRYKGFSFIVCLTIVNLMLIATFRPHTAGLHQAIESIYWVGLFVPLWLLVIGVSQTSLMVGGFRSKTLLSWLVLWEEETDPSAVRCGRNPMFETAFFYGGCNLQVAGCRSEFEVRANGQR